jgi:hypothetical protein
LCVFRYTNQIGYDNKRILFTLKISIMGKTGQSGQGNGGGWPSTTGRISGGGRSNNSSGGKK